MTEPVPQILQEHDTLQKAIDLFVRRKPNELPVVDEAGRLIGVVTTRELLRTCMPDYVLWMEDSSVELPWRPF